MPTRAGLFFPAYEPMPSWPKRLPPQHHSEPSVLVPQTKRLPTETVAHLPPGIFTGLADCLALTGPSWPAALSPQQ